MTVAIRRPGLRSALKPAILWGAMAPAALLGAATASANSALQGLSCASVQSCVAVGMDNTGANELNLVEELRDGAWQRVPAPAPSDEPGLSDVSCNASGPCVAVGGGGHGVDVLRRVSGVWMSDRAPAIDRTAGLQAVSCLGANWCVAVGQVGTFHMRMVSERFDGSAWRVVPTPPIPDANIFYMHSVSCPSRHFCMAVGDNKLGSSAFGNAPVAAIYNGSRWRLVRVPVPGRGPALYSVSCPGAGRCVAAGIRRFGPDPSPLLVVEYRAGRWSRVALTGTLPLGGAEVSCGAPGACAIVGTTWQGAAFAYRLSAGSWSPVILPPSLSGDGFGPVSCVDSASCVALGEVSSGLTGVLIGPGGASLLP